ncbi:Succinate dehydrogenase assembly factor 3, mitochondrial [Choanephora cucurbitarum]|uniref:Succinate dehydrogenase assembly factor 3 n=1 Tax=Choanephora cucurbitarum TaxID=101091 RepID=A0A1C7NIL8_9FUNG|nr:Succinate dehydrogenase assembly factor 3, mitochondrial [Choanephora cucurbitarum]
MPGPQQTQVLMAPLKLYRDILRSHRALPAAMRSMGDDYVKSEFKRHKTIDNPAHIVGFVSQWQSYLDLIKEQTAPLPKDSPAPSDDPLVRSFNIPANGGWGKKLDPQLLDKMSDEQLGQLYELRSEVKRSLGDE